MVTAEGTTTGQPSPKSLTYNSYLHETQALDPPIGDIPWDMKCGERKHLTCNQDRKRDAAEGGSRM